MQLAGLQACALLACNQLLAGILLLDTGVYLLDTGVYLLDTGV